MTTLTRLARHIPQQTRSAAARLDRITRHSRCHIGPQTCPLCRCPLVAVQTATGPAWACACSSSPCPPRPASFRQDEARLTCAGCASLDQIDRDFYTDGQGDA